MNDARFSPLVLNTNENFTNPRSTNLKLNKEVISNLYENTGNNPLGKTIGSSRNGTICICGGTNGPLCHTDARNSRCCETYFNCYF